MPESLRDILDQMKRDGILPHFAEDSEGLEPWQQNRLPRHQLELPFPNGADGEGE